MWEDTRKIKLVLCPQRNFKGYTSNTCIQILNGSHTKCLNIKLWVNMVKEMDIVPAIVRLNKSIVLINIRADDAVYSSFLSSLLFFWVLCK